MIEYSYLACVIWSLTYLRYVIFVGIKLFEFVCVFVLMFYRLFNVTINDISVIYVTAHRCAGGLKKLDLRSGSHDIL